MKKFVIFFSAFSLWLIAIAVALELFLSYNLRKNQNGSSKTWNDIMSGKINAEIIINGSSRASYQIDPQAFIDSFHVNTYNIGIPGTTISQQYTSLHFILKRNKKPSLIIHTLDNISLSKFNQHTPEYIVPYLLYNSTIFSSMGKEMAYHMYDYLIPSLRYLGRKQLTNDAIRIFHRPETNITDGFNGFRGKHHTFNVTDSLMERVREEVDLPPLQSKISLLYSYIEACKQNNIRLVFVYPPEYAGFQKKLTNKRKIVRLYSEIAKRQAVPLYDFSTDTLSLNKENYLDAVHLNTKGAQIFTNKIINAIVKDSIIRPTSKSNANETSKTI